MIWKLRRLHTGSEQQYTLNSQLLLVNFFGLAQFQINKGCFYLIFTTYVLFCTQIAVLFIFRAFLAAKSFSSPQKFGPNSQQHPVHHFQVTNNQSTSTINESFNIRFKKYQFLYHHQTIELPFDQSTY